MRKSVPGHHPDPPPLPLQPPRLPSLPLHCSCDSATPGEPLDTLALLAGISRTLDRSEADAATLLVLGPPTTFEARETAISGADEAATLLLLRPAAEDEPGLNTVASGMRMHLGHEDPDDPTTVHPDLRLVRLKRALAGAFEAELGEEASVLEARVQDCVNLLVMRNVLREVISMVETRSNARAAERIAAIVERNGLP